MFRTLRRALCVAAALLLPLAGTQSAQADVGTKAAGDGYWHTSGRQILDAAGGPSGSPASTGSASRPTSASSTACGPATTRA